MNEEKGSVVSGWRLLGLFLASPETGARTVAVRAPLLVPVFVVCTGMVALNFLSLPFTEHLARAQLPSGLDEVQLEQVERVQKLILQASVILTPFTLAVRWALIAGLLYLVSVIGNGRMLFRQSYSLVVLASLPLVAESAFTQGILHLRGVESVTRPLDLIPPIGLNLLIPAQSPGWYSILNSINLFEIWYVILLLLGISVLNGFGRTRSAAIVLSVWAFQVGTGVATVVLGGIGSR